MQINFNRVFAMMYRYRLVLNHSWDRITDLFYWPAMDLFIWGLTGIYFAKTGQHNAFHIDVILVGLIFWIVVWRAQYEINVNLLTEFWDKNIVNIFVSPLTLYEWILSFLLYGSIKMLVSLGFSAFLSFLLYKFNIFMFGFHLIPFVLSLLLTGWAVGFFVAAFLIRFGEKIQTLAWTGAYLISPFSAVFYPQSVLPLWAQKVAYFVPSSYVFEGLRQVIFTGKFAYDQLAISFLLNGIYLTLSIAFFIHMFKESKKIGLGHLI